MAAQRFQKDPRTDADVQVLLRHYQDLLADGRILTHEELEGLLKMRRTDARYKTVLRHFRRVVFNERQIFLDGVSAEGLGFRALTGNDMVRYGNRRLRHVGRTLKKAVRVLATPHDDEISDPHARAYRARVLVVAEQMAATHGRSMREVTTALRAPTQLRG